MRRKFSRCGRDKRQDRRHRKEEAFAAAVEAYRATGAAVRTVKSPYFRWPLILVGDDLVVVR